MDLKSIKNTNENRIREFKKLRFQIIKKIDAFVQKNNMGENKNHRKLQNKMEKYHKTITRKQKELKTGKQRKNEKIKVTKRYSFLISFLLIICFLYLLQIFIIIKTSVFLYTNYDFSIWLSYSFSLFLVIAIMISYLSYYSWRKIRKSNVKFLVVIIITPIILFNLFFLFYKSENNLKSDSMAISFTKLHPFLRIAVNMLILVDRNLIVTDIERTEEFYLNIGISKNLESMHYSQKDGYIHAVDIRTLYRSEFRNWIVKWYFRILGFNVLRHVGTADHIHVNI